MCNMLWKNRVGHGGPAEAAGAGRGPPHRPGQGGHLPPPHLQGVADPGQGFGLDAGEPDPPPPQPQDQRKPVDNCDSVDP